MCCAAAYDYLNPDNIRSDDFSQRSTATKGMARFLGDAKHYVLLFIYMR